MSFRLEQKNYDRSYLYKLPFMISPVCTIVTLIQKLLVGASSVVWAAVTAGLIDGVVRDVRQETDRESLFPCFLLLMAMAVIRRMGYSVGRFLTRKVQDKGVCEIQTELTKKAARVSYRILEDRVFCELQNELKDKTRGSLWGMLQQGGNFCQHLLRAAGVIGVLAFLDLRLGVAAGIVLIPLICFFIKAALETTEETMSGRGHMRRAEYLMRLATVAENVCERSLFDYPKYVKEDWRAEFQGQLSAEFAGMRRDTERLIGNGLLMQLAFLLLSLAIITLFAEGKISLGWMIAAVLLIYELDFTALHGIFDSVAVLARYNYFEDMTAFANFPEEEGALVLPSDEEETFESLEFRHVSFRYPRMTGYVLKDLNVKLTAGMRYAFVGRNGAGKTTIVRILTGVYDNYEGSILLNGRELREYAPERRKAMFAAVYQDSAGYEDSLANNILIGDIRFFLRWQRDKTKSLGRVEQCAKSLGLQELAKRLPEGWETLLGKESGDGVELSAGQWQKVIMARLSMNPAPVRILDEPAANLDPIRESRLYEGLEELGKDKTTLYISHRLGAVRNADIIFVLEEGCVRETGRHEELLAMRGVYAEMYESQKQWYSG